MIAAVFSINFKREETGALSDILAVAVFLTHKEYNYSPTIKTNIFILIA
jgi:hypothetical protein